MVKPRQDPPAMSRGSAIEELPSESNACDSIIKALGVGAGQKVTINDAASLYLKSKMQTIMETGSNSSGIDLLDLAFLDDEIKRKAFQSSIQDMFAGFDVRHVEHDEQTQSSRTDITSKNRQQPRAPSSSAKFMPQKPVRRPSVHPQRRSPPESQSKHCDALLVQILDVVTALERLDRAEKDARNPASKAITSTPTSSKDGRCGTISPRHLSLGGGSPNMRPKTSNSSRRQKVGNKETSRRTHSHAQPSPTTPTSYRPRKKVLARDTMSDPSPLRNRGSHRSQLQGSRSASSRDLIGSSFHKRQSGSQSSKGKGASPHQTRHRGSEGSTSTSHAKSRGRTRETMPSNRSVQKTRTNTSHSKEGHRREPIEFDFEQEESHSSSSSSRRGRGVSSSVPRRGRSRSVVRARSRSASLSSRNPNQESASAAAQSPRSHRSFFLLDSHVPVALSTPRPPPSLSSRRKNDRGTVQSEGTIGPTLSSTSLATSKGGASLSSGSVGTTGTSAPALFDRRHHEDTIASALAAAAAEFHDRSFWSAASPPRHFSRHLSKEAHVAHPDRADTVWDWQPPALQPFPSFDESDPLFSFDDSFSAFLSANRHQR
jgi:hypothetical protein